MSAVMPISMSSYGSQNLHLADYHSKLNGYVIMVSLIAASGGLLFGYDLGVTGKFQNWVSTGLKYSTFFQMDLAP